MECCCLVDYDYDGDWVDFNDDWKVAKKSLRCTECGSIIKKGENYLHTTGIWVEAIGASHKQNHKTCVICERIKKDLFCEGCNYASLWEELYSCLDIPFPEDYEKRPKGYRELNDKEYDRLEKQIYG